MCNKIKWKVIELGIDEEVVYFRGGDAKISDTFDFSNMQACMHYSIIDYVFDDIKPLKIKNDRVVNITMNVYKKEKE